MKGINDKRDEGFCKVVTGQTTALYICSNILNNLRLHFPERHALAFVRITVVSQTQSSATLLNQSKTSLGQGR